MYKGKKNLAVIANNISSYGGGEVFAIKISNALRKHFNVTILNLVSGSDTIRQKKRDIIRIHRLNGVRIIDISNFAVRGRAFGDTEYNLLMPKPRSLATFLSEIKRSDLVYNISSNPAVLSAAVLYSRIMGKKLVHGVHNYAISRALSGESRGKVKSALFRSIIGSIKYFHVVNSSDLAYIRSSFPDSKVYLIPNFYELKNARVTTKTDKFVVLFAGRLSVREKGIDLLAKIIESTLNANGSIIFHIAGSGDGEGILRGLEKKYKKNVFYLGHLSAARLKKEYATSNLFISTSRFEAFGITIIDAQANGLPVIAFTTAGSNDIIKKGFQGICIGNLDTGLFAKRIISHYALWQKDKRHYNSLKVRISKNTVGIYSYSKVTRDIVNMLRAIAGS